MPHAQARAEAAGGAPFGATMPKEKKHKRSFFGASLGRIDIKQWGKVPGGVHALCHVIGTAAKSVKLVGGQISWQDESLSHAYQSSDEFSRYFTSGLGCAGASFVPTWINFLGYHIKTF